MLNKFRAAHGPIPAKICLSAVDSEIKSNHTYKIQIPLSIFNSSKISDNIYEYWYIFLSLMFANNFHNFLCRHFLCRHFKSLILNPILNFNDLILQKFCLKCYSNNLQIFVGIFLWYQ